MDFGDALTIQYTESRANTDARYAVGKAVALLKAPREDVAAFATVDVKTDKYHADAEYHHFIYKYLKDRPPQIVPVVNVFQ